MGEAFLIGGNSGMSNAGAVKSRQEIVIGMQLTTLEDDNFFFTSSSYNKAYYADFTIQSVNIDKSIIISNSAIMFDDSSSFSPCARFINSSTIRVYATDKGNTNYLVGIYIQIVEFY